jgi:hypothetical protein
VEWKEKRLRNTWTRIQLGLVWGDLGLKTRQIKGHKLMPEQGREIHKKTVKIRSDKD